MTIAKRLLTLSLFFLSACQKSDTVKSPDPPRPLTNREILINGQWEHVYTRLYVKPDSNLVIDTVKPFLSNRRIYEFNEDSVWNLVNVSIGATPYIRTIVFSSRWYLINDTIILQAPPGQKISIEKDRIVIFQGGLQPHDSILKTEYVYNNIKNELEGK